MNRPGNGQSNPAAGDRTTGAVDSSLSPLAPSVLTGLIGQGIQLSRSPALHEAEGARQGLRVVYRLFDTSRMGPESVDLSALLNAARQCGFAGLNITYPFKQAVMPLLDRISDAANAVNAVNTVTFHRGEMVGHNTDVTGFYQGFVQGLPDARLARVLLIGAGGAGGAVAHALLKAGVSRLLVHDRDVTSAAKLAASVSAAFPAAAIENCTNLEATPSNLDGIVNATPVGMASHPGSPYPVERLHPEQWVADVVYFPLDTELILAARARGCQVLTGAAMAVHQAVGAFELFTGRPASTEHMRETFVEVGKQAG